MPKMPVSSRRRAGRRWFAALLACSRAAVCLLLAAGPDAALAGGRGVSLSLERQTVTDETVMRRQSYNYAPAVIHGPSGYHLYWCGGVAGDFILHLGAQAPGGPWTAATAGQAVDVALRPTNRSADFDALHTCDPNVIEVAGRYYLYYTAEQADGALSTIGVAAGTDGVHFERIGSGRPIVSPAMTNRDWAAHKLTYGAGQPAVAKVGSTIYLMFTDSTGSGANPINGAGQFVLRSHDPTFGSDVEELVADGWVRRAPGRHSAEYSVLESFGVDLAYDRASGLLVAVSDSTRGLASVVLLDPQRFSRRAASALALQWREGPALVAEADKTLRRPSCSTLDLQVLAAQGASDDPFGWHAIGMSAATFALKGGCPSDGR